MPPPTLVLCLLKGGKRQAMTTPVPAAGHLQIVTLGVWWDGSVPAWAPSASKVKDSRNPHLLAPRVLRALEARLPTRRGRGGACPGGGACPRGGARGAPWSRRPRPALPRSPRSPRWSAAELSSFSVPEPAACLAHRAASAPGLRRSPAQRPAGPAPPCPAAARPLLPAGRSRPSGCPPGL